MTKVYNYSSYRDFIKDCIEHKKQIVPTMTYAKLAEHSGVQKSYISQVINGRGSLNSDQLFLIGRRLGLKDDELDYLNLLLEEDRCQISDRKCKIQQKISKIRQKHCNSKDYLSSEIIEKVENEYFAQYYSDPYCTLIHIFLTIEDYRQKPTRIASRLNIGIEKLSDVLSILEKCNILKFKNHRVVLLKKSIHLDATSFLSRTNASMFRLKAIEKHQKSQDKEDYFFTASFSSNESVRRNIKKLFLEFLTEVSTSIKEEEADEVFHINFDLFQV